MITGNIVGLEILESHEFLQGVNPFSGEILAEKFSIANKSIIDKALDKAKAAFPLYKKWTNEQKANLLETIADEIVALGDVLIHRINQETGLPEGRITGERGRTTGQLKLFANMLREGSWTMPTKDDALPERQPAPRPDLRKVLRPIGPVVVFSASNFPLAFSTAGGDTASALAAGCPVILKAHSSHPGTNALVAEAILKAVKKTGAPDGVFSTLYGAGSDMGQILVADPRVKAVGFTGSLHAGRAIMDTAAKRPEPIPVYTEMGSLNPVLLLSSALENKADKVAETFAGSITMGVGQFCTKPGLIFVEDGAQFDLFCQTLIAKLSQVASAPMLNARMQSAFIKSLDSLSNQIDIKNFNSNNEHLVNPAIAMVSSLDFKANKDWHNEIFGPFAMVVKCKNHQDMLSILPLLSGQLTITIWSESNDARNKEILDIVEDYTGRIVWNGVPTGVEVASAMVHGGPYPATSNSLFTAVGNSAIYRWVRPVSYQNVPVALLPIELQD
ncbi:MAG: aldehyde dehydrogenase (NADP(+)) [Saprospiraceae bacterium]